MKRNFGIISLVVLLLVIVISLVSCANYQSCRHIYDNNCDTDCNICGKTRIVEGHSYANDCDIDCKCCGAIRDVKDHIYTSNCDMDCNECGKIRSVVPHLFTSDCDIDCDICGAIRIMPPHSYVNDCDEYCDVCGEKRVVKPHVYDNKCDSTCNVCGMVRNISHEFAMRYDEQYHWHECEVCGVIENKTLHIYLDGYQGNDDKHWRYCTDCLYTDMENHCKVLIYDEKCHWYECYVCHEKYDEENHTFNLEIEDEKYLKSEATATSEAAYYKVCRSCGQKGTDNHVWYKEKVTPDIDIYIYDKTYDGNPLTFMYNSTSDGEIELWYKLGYEDEFRPFTIGEIVNAGEYVVKIIARETADYYAGEKVANVTVKKVPLSLRWSIPDLLYDGTDKIASVVIDSGIVVGENVSVIPQLVSGDTTAPDQIIVYNAILVGADIINYTINPRDETVIYTIYTQVSCIHTDRNALGFCTLCGVYPDTFVSTGVDANGNPDGYYMYTKEFECLVMFEEIDPSSTTVYCRFKLGDNGVLKRTELEFYLCDYDLPDYEYNFDNYRAYVGDEDGNIVAEITDDLALWSNAFITLGDNYIYFVITLDGSLTQFAFGVSYYTNLN